MAVKGQIFTYCIDHVGRANGNQIRFYCDTEAELPTTNCIDGDFALTLDTGKPFTRISGAWVLNTQIDVVAVRLLETTGPTSLLIGNVSDNQFLKRSGTNIIGATPPAGGEAFPVGSVFLSVVSTNPATLLGYGTWSAIGAGRVLVGLDSGDPDFDTLEETGGAKSITLTEAQIPAHTHVQNSHNHTQDSHNHTQNSHVHTQQRNNTATGANTGWTTAFDTSSSNPVADVNTGTGATTAVNQAAVATNQAATAVNQNTGGGGSHSNVQPYFVVNIWKRTA